jgi:hypothetical protein
MTGLLAIFIAVLLLVTCGGVIVLLIAAVEDRRERAYWRAHNRRLAEYHERKAADNGRPHTDGVTDIATRQRP